MPNERWIEVVCNLIIAESPGVQRSIQSTADCGQNTIQGKLNALSGSITRNIRCQDAEILQPVLFERNTGNTKTPVPVLIDDNTAVLSTRLYIRYNDSSSRLASTREQRVRNIGIRVIIEPTRVRACIQSTVRKLCGRVNRQNSIDGIGIAGSIHCGNRYRVASIWQIGQLCCPKPVRINYGRRRVRARRERYGCAWFSRAGISGCCHIGNLIVRRKTGIIIRMQLPSHLSDRIDFN